MTKSLNITISKINHICDTVHMVYILYIYNYKN